MNYEMMIDPFNFGDFKSMKPKQAQQYFDWFVSEIPHRMEVLQKFIVIKSIKEQLARPVKVNITYKKIF